MRSPPTQCTFGRSDVVHAPPQQEDTGWLAPIHCQMAQAESAQQACSHNSAEELPARIGFNPSHVTCDALRNVPAAHLGGGGGGVTTIMGAGLSPLSEPPSQ